ncbi:MAG: hypothetical protein GY847_37640 [Proteobacteria bacterium]|nr:hypothetical protein [Pseudomonadota bacterium]
MHEGLRYGEDRMVFLREFAQNARDARASQIRVSTGFENSGFVLCFEDDGLGMGYDHAREYLFTLYTSSKEHEATSAGRFGVGFWSVLLFQPSEIEIESREADRDSWKIELDGDLSRPRLAIGSLETPGTRIVIKQSAKTRDEADQMGIKVEKALVRYCRYLKQRDKSTLPLPIFFNGKMINRDFKLDGPCWMSFRNDSVEGAVGLGERPRIDLYARGLLVWQGTVLDELRYGASPRKKSRHAQGLAPVYVLCGNDLNVTLDRRAVVDDRALGQVRRIARQRMRKLLWQYLDRVSKRWFGQRVVDRLNGFVEDIRLGGHLPALIAFCVTVFLLGGAVLITIRSARAVPDHDSPLPGGPALSSPGDKVNPGGGHSANLKPKKVAFGSLPPFLGPAVDPVLPSEQVALGYSPAGPKQFRATAYEQLHAGLGIKGSAPQAVSPAPKFRCASDCLDIHLEITADPGAFVVPTPTGHSIESPGISLNGRPVAKLDLSKAGEPVIVFDGAVRGVLKYRSGPGAHSLDHGHRIRLLKLPRFIKLPNELNAAVAAVKKEASVTEQIESLRRFVEKRLLYDRSLIASEAYTKFLTGRPKAGWLDFVLSYGRGDCDVKNTVLVFLLRRIGVPARLAIGLVGENGQARPGMHAWVEYYDGTWRQTDATGTDSREAGTVLPTLPNIPSKNRGFTTSSGSQLDTPSSWMKNVAMWAGAIAIIALGFALFLMLAREGSHQLFAPEDEGQQRRVAAEMVTNALTYPDAWLGSGGITLRRLLPVHGSSPAMSLREALARGSKERLWCSNGETDLVKRAIERKVRILDISDPAFGPLIERLPGIVDLDDTALLRPTRPKKLDGDLKPVGRLIQQMNRLLVRSGLPDGIILPCFGLKGSIFRDVDLSGLRMRRHLSQPTRFVAVQPQSEMILERATLGRAELDLAAFLTLDILAEKSDLLRPHQKRIRQLAARAVFEEVR